jgi:hypothetical protein
MKLIPHTASRIPLARVAAPGFDRRGVSNY